VAKRGPPAVRQLSWWLTISTITWKDVIFLKISSWIIFDESLLCTVQKDELGLELISFSSMEEPFY
jgi:hypothetical protein